MRCCIKTPPWVTRTLAKMLGCHNRRMTMCHPIKSPSWSYVAVERRPLSIVLWWYVADVENITSISLSRVGRAMRDGRAAFKTAYYHIHYIWNVFTPIPTDMARHAIGLWPQKHLPQQFRRPR